jgi:hypothetical protein
MQIILVEPRSFRARILCIGVARNLERVGCALALRLAPLLLPRRQVLPLPAVREKVLLQSSCERIEPVA